MITEFFKKLFEKKHLYNVVVSTSDANELKVYEEPLFATGKMHQLAFTVALKDSEIVIGNVVYAQCGVPFTITKIMADGKTLKACRKS